MPLKNMNLNTINKLMFQIIFLFNFFNEIKIQKFNEIMIHFLNKVL